MRVRGGIAVIAGCFLLAGCTGTAAQPTRSPLKSTTAPTSAPPASPAPTPTGPVPLERQPQPAVTPVLPKSHDEFPPLITRIPTDDKVVFITIDDGVAADPRILKLLTMTGIPVTPFLTADQVRMSKEYYREVRDLTGQAVQNHTISHPQMPLQSDAEKRRQICGASREYKADYDFKPWLFRPPFGEYDTSVRAAAGACGIKYVVNWSVSLPQRHLRYLESDKLRAGDIILTHWRPDLYPHLRHAIQVIHKQGFRVAALQDYLPR